MTSARRYGPRLEKGGKRPKGVRLLYMVIGVSLDGTGLDGFSSIARAMYFSKRPPMYMVVLGRSCLQQVGT